MSSPPAEVNRFVTQRSHRPQRPLDTSRSLRSTDLHSVDQVDLWSIGELERRPAGAQDHYLRLILTVVGLSMTRPSSSR
jgi:hypothetical protein